MEKREMYVKTKRHEKDIKLFLEKSSGLPYKQVILFIH